MRDLRAAGDIALTVVVTVLIAAGAYGTVQSGQRPVAAVQTANPKPSPTFPLEPVPPPVPSPVSAGNASLYAYDVDMIDAATGWMLVSDCPLRNAPTCIHAVARTSDGGRTWTTPVHVGHSFAGGDGGAPRSIRFLNRVDGFVYGSSAAFVTHDGGASWSDWGVSATFVSSIAMAAGTLWAVTYPCPKGFLCQYEVRSSRDAGRSWSPVHKLPLNFSPTEAVAFDSGLLLGSVPPGRIEITTDSGQTWRDVTTPCTEAHFGSSVATADGVDLWHSCQDYPGPSGALTSGSLFVSSNSGAAWAERNVQRHVLQWVVSPRARVAFASSDNTTIGTWDDGLTWTKVAPTDAQFDSMRWRDPGFGWALDSGRVLWVTADAGRTWSPAGTVPDRL